MKKLIEITQNKVLGKLPDPFTFDDGTRVKTADDWERRRKEIYKTAVELQYGTLPPDPEFLEVERIFAFKDSLFQSYRITTGTKQCPVSFTMMVMKPAGDGKFPTVVDGDLCFKYVFDKDFINEFTSNGIMLACFNRTELMPDNRGTDRNIGQLHKSAASS